jgi:hypothetical protein
MTQLTIQFRGRFISVFALVEKDVDGGSIAWGAARGLGGS